MTIDIVASDHGEVFVNDKRIHLDHNGNWLADEELLPSERTAFNQYIKKQSKWNTPTT